MKHQVSSVIQTMMDIASSDNSFGNKSVAYGVINIIAEWLEGQEDSENDLNAVSAALNVFTEKSNPKQKVINELADEHIKISDYFTTDDDYNKSLLKDLQSLGCGTKIGKTFVCTALSFCPDCANNIE